MSLTFAKPTSQKFATGQVIITKEALSALRASGQSAEEFIDRHQGGDWGYLSCAETDENEHAVNCGSLVRSVYKTASGARLWVMTAGDRSTTTIVMAP